MLATLVGNGAAWSVATLPAIKVNSHRFQRLVKVAVGTFRTCRIALTMSVDRGQSGPRTWEIVEIANSVEAGQDGRIHIEKINTPFLYRERGTPNEYSADLELAISRAAGWSCMRAERL